MPPGHALTIFDAGLRIKTFDWETLIMKPPNVQRIFALLLIAAAAMPWAAAKDSEPPGALAGTVILRSEQAPLGGATVFVGDPTSGKVHAAAPTGADGRFSLEGLPASRYQLAVGVADGIYLVDTPVLLAAGRTQEVQLAVQPNTEQSPSRGASRVLPRLWNNPLTAALIVLGSAFLIGALVESATDDEDDPSPSQQ